MTRRHPRRPPLAHRAAAPWRAWRLGVAGVPELVIDAAVAAVVAALASGAMVVSDEPATRPADGLAYALLLAASAPLALRRRWPPAALLATAAVALAYFLRGYPGGPPTVVLLVALYSAAAAGRRWWALAVTGVFAGGGLAFRALVEREALVGVLLNAALFVLVVVLGEAVWSRRTLRAEVAARLRRAAEERERDAHRRVARERVRIARELHDVLAHTVAAMAVQAGVAADSIDDRPDDARAALRALRAAAREATTELRATVALLRDAPDSAPPPPSPGLADLDELVEAGRLGGVEVRVRTCGEPRPLPAAVDFTAFRVVQEAVTNVVRHAGAASATVSLRHEPGVLVVTVDDDGRGPARWRPAGYGLVGIRERAEALGGSASFGGAPTGGFRVRVRLPVEEA